MKFIEVKEIPGPYPKGKRHLQKAIDEFAKSEAQVAKIDVEQGEYASTKTMVSSLSDAIKRSGHPIKVTQRRDEVYIYKI